MELSRTIKELDSYLGNFTEEFKKKISQGKKIKVLDAGCGNGLAMIGLAKMFNKINLVGYNLKRKQGNKKSMKEKSLKLDLVSENEFKNLKKSIRFVYFDADKKFPFKPNSFDFIYSLASVYLYKDKIKFLENCNKALKEGGTARIQLMEIKNSSSNFLKNAENFKNFIEIWEDKKLVSFKDYLEKFNGVKIKLGKKDNGNKIIYIEVRKQDDLNFNLEFVSSSNPNKNYKNPLAVKSVYKIKASRD